MGSRLAMQSLFSIPKIFFVNPPSMAYGKFKYDKKPGVGRFILELFAKKEKNVENLHFFTDFTHFFGVFMLNKVCTTKR